jgi:hypothetical protein
MSLFPKCFADSIALGFYYLAYRQNQQSSPTTNLCAFDALFHNMRLSCLTTAWIAAANPMVKAPDCPNKKEPLETKTATKTTTAITTTTAATSITLLPRAAPSNPAICRCQSAHLHVMASVMIPLHMIQSHTEKTHYGRA